jgi:GST-like protein
VIGADYRVTVISLLGWVSNPTRAYGARELVGVDRFLRMRALLNRATGGATWLQVTAD